jgi:F-type H+-transporting ATPase subunit a
MPQGAPTRLIILLPLIERLSQILRPFTLAVRLSVNLGAGHILVYIFAYFTALLPSGGEFVNVRLIVLVILELIVSILQRYIFTSLLILYYRETYDLIEEGEI